MNSTINANTAKNLAGGIGNGAGYLTVVSSTVAGNSSSKFSASNLVNGEHGHLRLKQTIVANPVDGDNCEGNIETLGFNIDSDGSCALKAEGDLGNANPRLAPLTDNGGFTRTRGLLPGSPAINAVSVDFCQATDQRYYSRIA